MEEELYNALEKLNEEKKELLNSKEYKLGCFFIKNLKLLKKFKIANVMKNINGHINKKKISKKYNTDIQKKCNKLNKLNYKTVKIAVYICIVGDYDNIQTPLLKFDNVDYFLITNNEEKYREYSNYFNIISLEEEILKNGNILANRYIKFHPDKYLKEYDYAIYMDGNVRITSDIRKYILSINEKTGIAMYNHRERDDIYNEAEVCKILKRGNRKYIDWQMERYKKEGFPEKFGMNEATIIISDLKNLESIRLLDEWYKEFEISKSLRDQLAWPYVLWKNKYTINDVGSLGNNIFRDNCIEIVKHK